MYLKLSKYLYLRTRYIVITKNCSQKRYIFDVIDINVKINETDETNRMDN